jgi:hypothetical protein
VPALCAGLDALNCLIGAVPPIDVRRFHARFSYQAGACAKPRRVIAKVEWYPGELYPRVGFIVTKSCRTFAADAVRLQLHALSDNLGNFLRILATPEPIKDWSLTSLK